MNQVKGTYFEVADHSTQMAQEMVRRGLMVRTSTSAVDVTQVEPFDVIKVALKRGELDWFRVVPSMNSP